MKYTNQEYEELRAKARLHELAFRIRSGFRAFTHSPIPWLWSAVYWLMFLLLPRVLTTAIGLGSLGAKLLSVVFVLAFPLFFTLYLALVALSATPRRAWAITDAFLRTGLVNRAGEPPFVVETSRNHIVVRTNGISLAEFDDYRDKLESALNVRITRLEEGKDKQHIVLHTAPGSTRLPTNVPMAKDKLPEGASILSLGESLDGPVNVDLSIMPHMLIGGSTGSGKTYLVLSLILQAIMKGYQVYILDMKGGVDYPPAWKGDLCSYFDDRKLILSCLSMLVKELENRKAIFQCPGNGGGKPCANIDVYNRYNPSDLMPRILVVCDELAEITDTTGLDKPNKELVNAIVGKLGTLARLGRAFGLHLVMATQRPDANVVPGQIKNNADIKICGRADIILSTIILDNGDAANLPKDIPGRFLCNLNGGTTFQGYTLPDLDDDNTGG